MKSSDDLSAKIQANKNNGFEDLTEAQKLFAMKYVETYVIKTAAESAEVSAATAGTWLRDPLFLEYVNLLQAELNQSSVITKDFVNLQWLKLMPKLLGEEQVAMVDKDGVQFNAHKFHASESVSLLKELSKSTDFYAPDKTDDSIAAALLSLVDRLDGA